jgi:hypothetical protein
MPLPTWLTPDVALIAIVFMVSLFLLYKLFKLLVRASIAGVIGFAFPWIINGVANYFGIALPFVIPATMDMGIKFALAGIGLVVVYEFLHFILYFLKLITWPVRAAIKK